MEQRDLKSNIEMYFRQINSLAELMFENNNKDNSNLLTISNLAELGLAEVEKLHD